MEPGSSVPEIPERPLRNELKVRDEGPRNRLRIPSSMLRSYSRPHYPSMHKLVL